MGQVHLPLIHLDTVFTDVVAKKLYGGLMEGTFLSFEGEIMFLGDIGGM